jgi:hypothetical protein
VLCVALYALYSGSCVEWTPFVESGGGGGGDAFCVAPYTGSRVGRALFVGTGDDTLCATLYAGSCGG